MIIKNFILQIISPGKPDFPAQRTLASLLGYVFRYGLVTILYGISLLYRGAVQIRIKLYQTGILKQHALPCPVISIGNITTGGTGKTPMVILIAQLFRQHGKRVAILTRGYKRTHSEASCVVIPGSTDILPANPLLGEPALSPVLSLSKWLSKGARGRFSENLEISLATVGDEPLLIARKLNPQHFSFLQHIPVIVGSQRYRSGRLAIKQFHPDVILLDDGFQHIQLNRTCDVVLIDATNPFGGGYLLPAGLLREPVKNLARAHAFVIMRSDEIEDITPICQRLQLWNPEAPIFKGKHICDAIKKAGTDEHITIEMLKGKRLLGVSGLGNPGSFHRLLEQLGLPAVKYLDFPDHHWYTEKDVTEINRTISTHQIEAIITTEKDEFKLAEYSATIDVPVYVVTIKVEGQPQKEFEDLLLGFVKKKNVPF